MESKELRTGNYLQRSGGSIITVKRLIQNDNDILVNEADGLFTLGYTALPIQLTEEILLKCGFVLGIRLQDFVKGKYCFVDKKDGIFYGEFSEEGVFYFNSKTKIYYLHQLQNLYFALIGQELEIKL